MTEQRQLDIGGEATTVAVGGGGPPVLFLHGEANTSSWRAFHDALSHRFTVYAPLLPGFGGSPLPTWLSGMDDVAYHLVDVVDALDLERPLVVGESLGGWAAMTLGITRPERLRAVVLVGALGLRPSSPPPDLFIRPGPDAVRHLAETVDAAPYDPLTGDTDAATALWLDQAAHARLAWERPYDRALPRRAHHLSVPVRVVWGGADRLLPVSHGAELAALFGAPPPMVVDGAGHLVTVDAPDAVADAVAAFSSELP